MILYHLIIICWWSSEHLQKLFSVCKQQVFARVCKFVLVSASDKFVQDFASQCKNMQVCAIVCKQQISAIVCKLLQDFANSKFCKVMQSFAVVYKQQVFAIVCKQKDCASLQVGCLENINMGPKGNLMNFYFPILMRFSKFDNHFFFARTLHLPKKNSK